MKLATITNVSVDGVMQGLGGPEEDRGDGFERGGWALPLFDDETENRSACETPAIRRADRRLWRRNAAARGRFCGKVSSDRPDDSSPPTACQRDLDDSSLSMGAWSQDRSLQLPQPLDPSLQRD